MSWRARTRSSTAAPAATGPIDRLSAPVRGPGFWLALWAVVDRRRVRRARPGHLARRRAGRDRAGDLPAGRRLVRGLRADRLAPAAGQPQRPAHDRRPASASSCRRFVGQIDAAVAQTAAILVQDLWAPFFVALLLTLLTGGRLASRVDWLLVGGVRARAVRPAGRLAAVLRAGRQPAGRVPERRHRRRGRQGAAHAGRPGLRRRRGRGRGALARGVAPRRRALLPSVAGASCLLLFAALLVNDLVDGSRSQTVLWLGDLLAGQRARRRSSSACCARGWPAAAWPTSSASCRHDARRRAAGGAGPDARRPEPRRRLPPARSRWATPTPTGARCWCRRSPPTARPRAVESDGAEVAALVYDALARRRPRAGRGRPRRGGASRSRTSACTPSPRPGSPSCRRRASASSRPATPSAGGSSATCTTARSSGWSRSRCSCG